LSGLRQNPELEEDGFAFNKTGREELFRIWVENTPEPFRMGDFKNEMSKRGIPESTSQKWLESQAEEGGMVSKLNRGVYRVKQSD